MEKSLTLRTRFFVFLTATLPAAVACGWLWLCADAAADNGCGTGGPVYLTNFVRTLTTNQGVVVSLDIAGGTSGVLYDILTATNLAPNFTNSQWTRLGQGYACNTYTFTHQPVGRAFYALSGPPLTNICPCGAGVPVYLTNLSCAISANQGVTVGLKIAGGQSNVIYDIFCTTNLAGGSFGNSSWTWVGQGYTCNSYTFAHQPAVQALYAVGPPPSSSVVAWGDDSSGQCDVPAGLNNAVAVAGGMGFSVALRGDGSLVAWGDNTYGQTNIPPGLTNVMAIAAGPYHGLALRADGTVSAWGAWYPDSFPPAVVPPGLSNVVRIAAGGDHDVALKADGTVAVWGYTNTSYNTVPPGLGGVTAIAAGWNHNSAVLNNGRVTNWGINGAALGWNLTVVPPDLTNAVAVAASALHTVALRNDGRVEAWGYNADGQTNVPAGLSNVVSVSAGEAHSLALQRDGTVVLWGDFGAGNPAYIPEGLSGVTAIGSGAHHCLAIRPASSVPLILRQPSAQSQMIGGTVTFSAQGAGAASMSYQWQFNGVNIAGATNASLTLTNVQTSQQGSYRVVISDASGSISSSTATLVVITPPPPAITAWTRPARQWVNYQSNLTLSITVSNPPGLPTPITQWQWNGRSLAQSQPTSTNYTIWSMYAGEEGTYSVTVTNQWGSKQCSWNVETAFPGGVALWGADNYAQADRPSGLMSNVVAVAGGASNSVALMANGTVVQWGYNWGSVPANLTNAIAVSAGYSHALALRNDGTVVSWGDPHDAANVVPTNLAGVKAIAAGWSHNLALLTNGVVTAWGVDGAILGWHLTEVPSGLSNVTAIAAGSLHSLALRADGTVVGWGYSPNGETNVPAGLSNVVAIAAGGQHSLALKADGTMVAWGNNSSGQCAVPPGLSNVTAVAAGWAHSLALKNDGTVTAWGDDSQGETEIGTNLCGVKSIAAGAFHSIAAIFSPLVSYPMDVSRDLLLVYNSKSAASSNVFNYYVQNRPLVGKASVLSLACTVGETIQPADFTNQIFVPITNWLAANPTKRPRYVVLFLDVPSRVNSATVFPYYGSTAFPSVSYQLATGITNWHPFVTHINMGDSNACIAYVNKLVAMASRYSPGKLFISASGGGYANTNYVIDDIRNGYGHPDDFDYCWWFGWQATNGLLQSGVSPAAIQWADGSETLTNNIAYNLPHLTNAVNVAGYMSWGCHSSLGSGYATAGPNLCKWTGNSSWYLVGTIESFNGQMYEGGQGNFVGWFSPTAFGGTNYANTPVGAVCHVDEPYLTGIENEQSYFGLWAGGSCFANCAWMSMNTPYCMAVGDPFVCH